MLLDARLPLNLWGEAVVAVCHVRNRSPIAGTQVGTPLGLFFGIVPDGSHFRVYGSKVFCHVPKTLRNKPSQMSSPGVLAG
jgi:hypothetical protein